MQIRKKFKYSKDNDGQINIIYNIPDEVYTNTRIKGEPFARLKVDHPKLFKIVKELHDYDILIVAIGILIVLLGITMFFNPLFANAIVPICLRFSGR